jgi:hypothetical protein
MKSLWDVDLVPRLSWRGKKMLFPRSRLLLLGMEFNLTTLQISICMSSMYLPCRHGSEPHRSTRSLGLLWGLQIGSAN